METQKEFSRLWQLSVLGINAGFDRAFRDLEKRGGGAVWALLIAGIFGWQFGLVAGANWLIFLLFLFYGWDSRVVAGGALLYLASCPFLLSFKQDAWAEAMAVQAYFFLVMPALVSIQCNPVMIAFYNRLKDKGKNGKVIVCAIMRKLVHVIFGVLKSGKMYDPNFNPISP